MIQFPKNIPGGNAGQVEYSEHDYAAKAKKVIKGALSLPSDGSRNKKPVSGALGTTLTLSKDKSYRIIATASFNFVLWDADSGMAAPTPDSADVYIPANTEIRVDTEGRWNRITTLGSGTIQAAELL